MYILRTREGRARRGARPRSGVAFCHLLFFSPFCKLARRGVAGVCACSTRHRGPSPPPLSFLSFASPRFSDRSRDSRNPDRIRTKPPDSPFLSVFARALDRRVARPRPAEKSRAPTTPWSSRGCPAKLCSRPPSAPRCPSFGRPQNTPQTPVSRLVGREGEACTPPAPRPPRLRRLAHTLYILYILYESRSDELNILEILEYKCDRVD